MRLPKIRGFSYGYSFSIAKPTQARRHHLELWEQPLHRWLIARAYHWYDMSVYRLPGFRALERLLDRLHRSDEWHIPLGCRQDLRCYDLQQRQRTTLATFDISAEDYKRIQPNRPDRRTL